MGKHLRAPSLEAEGAIVSPYLLIYYFIFILKNFALIL